MKRHTNTAPDIFLPKNISRIEPGNEESILNRREIEPLLSKARKVLTYYYQALDCSVTIHDGDDTVINSPELKMKIPLSNESKRPCQGVHREARSISRQNKEVYLYSCESGYVFWTCPLFRNGRYAGALTAGRILASTGKANPESCPLRKEADKRAETETLKSHEEIQAMARMLGICAAEVSEKNEEPGELIRRIVNQDIDVKNGREYIPAGDKQIHKDRLDPAYFMEKERLLLAAFRRGDNETGKKFLRDIMDNTIAAVQGNIDLLRFKAVELMVLLSRSAVTAGAAGNETLMEANNRNMKRIQESCTIADITENLYLIADSLAGKIFSFQGIPHASALRKAERFIWNNYTRKISLTDVARASGLSGPYFSTIFKEETGESLCNYLNRLRVEKAQNMLTETGKSLNEIALICGFRDQSWFSKIFKAYTGFSPGKFREQGGKLSSRFCKRYTRKDAGFHKITDDTEKGEAMLSS